MLDSPRNGRTLGTFSLLSIGIGGMIGGGIFAVTGLAIALTRGAAPLAFIVAGFVAMLTAYSYWKLTLRYPSAGGSVEFINRAFGSGFATGSLSILLCLSYIILLAIYAYAFGSYGAELFGGGAFLAHGFATGILILLALLNFTSPPLVIRSENSFNLIKISILGAFIIIGFILPGHFARIDPADWVRPMPLVGGAMVIFLNYEGFELIANVAPQARNPRRSLPLAYLGGVSIVMIVYVLIAVVVVAHLNFSIIQAHSDSVLVAAARELAGNWGGMLLVIAALIATSSAINATFYGSGRLTYLIAKYGELPSVFEHDIRRQPVDGMITFCVLSTLLVNIVPLSTIATMGSAGFLLVFAAINLANFRLARETLGWRPLAIAGSSACLLAFMMLCWQTMKNPATRWQIIVLAALVALSAIIESLYRFVSNRELHMGHSNAAPPPDQSSRKLNASRSRGERYVEGSKNLWR